MDSQADFATIEFNREKGRWVVDLEQDNSAYWLIFREAARNSKLHWEALDFFQKYSFKILYVNDGPSLRFLGVDTRYGEYVTATKDQMVLGKPA